jgi:hypothetical protein
MSSPNPTSIDVRCEISYLDEPIRGELSDGEGRSVPFRGWIELSAALTSLVEDAKTKYHHSKEKEPSDA